MLIGKKHSKLLVNRYREIASTLVKYGLGWLAQELNLGRLIPFHHGLLGRFKKTEAYTQPERARMTLEDLGVTFIKLGQMLSTRPDLLPPEYIEQFSKLRDSVAPFPYEEVSRVIRQELGSPPEELFKSFDIKPVASASIGQVHKAVLKDGTNVAVKIQRPGIDALVERDIEVLSTLARFASRRIEFAADYNIDGWVDEFAFTLRNELDYRREGQNADRIKRNFGDDPAIHVPEIFWGYTSGKVLTMEEVSGIKINDNESLTRAGLDCGKVVRNYTHILITMAIEHGFFHADPHPGNFFVLPNEVIAVVDYGMVGRLDEDLRLSIIRMYMAMTHRDSEQLMDELLALGVVRKVPRKDVFKRDIGHFIDLFYDKPLEEIELGKIFGEFFALARRHKLQLPTDLILYFKVIAIYEGVSNKLDPDFNLIEFAEPYFKNFWLKSRSVRRQAKRIREASQEMMELGFEVPRYARRMFKQLERGEFTFTSRIEGLEETLAGLQNAADRISKSVLAAALLVCAGLLMLIYQPPGWERIKERLFVVLFVIAVVFTLVLLFSIWRAGRFRRR
ncbi:MAG TPA: hypothetical protein DCP92_23060 [Nitrospiraceae bacterium]|jgi:ubiquinone biosynthesis protein|nr:hypothetical protein [Nitrospiraceae bacterium]